MSDINIYAPIALFVYNRPWHTKQTVEALLNNELASDSDLFIFSDAPKAGTKTTRVDEVRAYIHQITGFKSVTIVERETNFGLARSIIDGVTSIVNQHGKIIVLEDDLVTSPYFLKFMNDALNLYEKENRVISIHGYVYPVNSPLPEAFFLQGADCWGWATWRSGWACFNDNGHYLLNELQRRKLQKAFDFNGAYPYYKMLEGQVAGINDSWAVRWYASAFLADKLTLYPGRSLVHNIGNDESGIHCGKSTKFDSSLGEPPIDLGIIPVKPSPQGRLVFEIFFRQCQRGWLDKLSGKAYQLLKRIRGG